MAHYKLNETEVTFCRDRGHAIADAENAFVEQIEKICPDVDAAKVFRVYKSGKLVKFDRANRRYVVKHGAFLDADVIARAGEG